MRTFWTSGTAQIERGRPSGTFGVRIGVMRKQDLHEACVAEQGRRHHGRYAVGVHGVRVGAAVERSLDLAGSASPNRREQRVRRRRRLSGHAHDQQRRARAGDGTSCRES